MAGSRRRAGPHVLGLLCLGAIGVGAFFASRSSTTSTAIAPAVPGPGDDRTLVEANPESTRAPGQVERLGDSALSAPADESVASAEEGSDGDGEAVLMLEGVVRSTVGPGVEGAEVRFGPALALTDSTGSFELEVGNVVDETPVVATKAGYEPAVIPGFGATVRARTGPLEPVELVLGASPGELTGRLISTQETACPNWEIALYDASPVDPGELAGPSAEDLAAGSSNRQRTGADGSFRMAGLRSDRTYRLRTWNQDTLQSFVSEAIAPGTRDFTFVVPLDAVHPEVHGVVVGHDGVPLEGIKVRLSMFVDEGEVDGAVRWNENHTGQTVVSDESGRFSLLDVPHENVFLRFHGGDVAAAPYWFQPDSPVDDLRITLARQGRFRLELDGPATARPDALEVWDVQGEVVAVKTTGAYPPPGRVALPGGGELPEYRTTDDARWLVLYRDGREVGRQELRIRAGETVTVGY